MRKARQSRKAPEDLISAAKSGDRLKTLIALRDMLAERLQHTESSRDISSMSRRLMQCISEIEVLERMKKDAEESPFKLTDFRKKIINDYGEMQKGYKTNPIDSEHEAL